MTESSPLNLYDISSPIQPPKSYAPNPSKSRLALSFKCVHFRTVWVDITEIPGVRSGLKCPVVRHLDDGSDYPTLPMLEDPITGQVIGDSFDIADYLEEKFPKSGGCLFPPTCAALNYESPAKDTAFFAPLSAVRESKHHAYARFNQHVDCTFSAHVHLVGEYLPFNPETAETVKATFVKRAHLKSWDDLKVRGDARQQGRAAYKNALTSLAKMLTVNESGPYFEGEQANYADLIVGGWLNFLSVVTPKEEWEDFRTWHGGVFARLHDALQEKYFVCT